MNAGIFLLDARAHLPMAEAVAEGARQVAEPR